jgi:hypothetical protein
MLQHQALCQEMKKIAKNEIKPSFLEENKYLKTILRSNVEQSIESS